MYGCKYLFALMPIKFKKLGEMVTTGAYNPGLPQVALGQRPSDAMKPKAKLKKVTGTTNKHGGEWKHNWQKNEEANPKTVLKLKIKKIASEPMYASVDADTKSYGEPYRALDTKKVKIRLKKISEGPVASSICVCSHDRDAHGKHECSKCPPDRMFHKHRPDIGINAPMFMDVKRKWKADDLYGPDGEIYDQS